jgi:hypothetical protein
MTHIRVHLSLSPRQTGRKKSADIYAILCQNLTTKFQHLPEIIKRTKSFEKKATTALKK